MSKLRLLHAAVFFIPTLAHADDVLHLGTPVLERPTLMSLGVQLPITGDDNYNATVTLRYRKSGAVTWRTGQPLYRVHPESIVGWTATPQFAGSIIDLRPNTQYEIELHAVDPDGGVNQTFTLTAATRPVPGDPATPRVVNVSSTSGLSAALATAQPGDVITIANGVYTGNFEMGASGTAANPIVIRGESLDGAILDGGNRPSYAVLQLFGSFVHIEQLTLRNSDWGIHFENAGTQGNVVRRTHLTNVRLGIFGRPSQYDFYIADNVLEGRIAWPLVYSDDGGGHSEDTGITVNGFGMVVAHNRLSGFGDSMRSMSRGARANDFYGNDILWSYDNGLELDESEGNVRALRNRFTNVFAPISVQPIYLGPAYIMRNIEMNPVDEHIKFHPEGSAQLSGVLVYHNTFLSSWNALQTDTWAPIHHVTLENNIFIGPTPLHPYAVNFNTPIDAGHFDYNGYFPDGPFLINSNLLGRQTYPAFAAWQGAGMEIHGRILNGQIFANGLTAPTDYHALLPPPDVTPAASGPAIDKGAVLPGFNDTFTGAAPDLGAVESGCPAVVYGPRQAGIDESNQSIGCETPGTSPAPPPPPTPVASAAFLKLDTTTQGTWRGVYGADGYQLAGDFSSRQPSYGQMTLSGQGLYGWTSYTPDVRALQYVTGPDRHAAKWESGGSFTVDLNLTPGTAHQIAVYVLDWEYLGLIERIDVIDAATGVVLDTRMATGFTAGQYLVWKVNGHVQLKITNTIAATGSISAVFFDSYTAVPTPASAQFVKLDTATQGSWRGVYGADGYLLAGDGTQQPSYGQAAVSGQTLFTWAASTTDARALQKTAIANDRIAATWYASPGFTIDVNLAAGASHQVALYAMDYDSMDRAARVDVVDAATGIVLDSRSFTNFTDGQYLVWTISGHVVLRVSGLNRINTVASGIFFGPASGDTPPPSGAAQFVKVDPTTKGAWRAAYGAEGFLLAADGSQQASYGQVALTGQSQYTWAASTADPRALQKSANANDRIAATWFSTSAFTIDLNFAGGASHQIALYTIDYDSLNRSERFDVVDAGTGAVLDSRSVSGFSGGQYLVWNVSGHVQIRATNVTGINGVVSGIFLGGASPAASAQFVKMDPTTKGAWRAVYGSEGFLLAADGTQQPSYGQVALAGQSQYTWAASTTDARGLQKAANASDRIAATWYADTAFTIDLNLAPGTPHQVALYALDYDSLNRAERVDVIDASTGTVLDSRNVATFSGGQYLVWTVNGHVQIKVNTVAGMNAVVAGVFLGGAAPPSAQFVKLDAATKGSWRAAYGSEGFLLAADGVQQPAYGQVALTGQSQYTWATSTTDARALQKSANASDRVAATWYSDTAFTIDVNLAPGTPHQVALYTIDYDSLNRGERFDVIDPATGAVLDSRSVSNFSGGQYLVWTLTGHVQIRVTTVSGMNSVVSGVFFGAPSVSAQFVKLDTTTKGTWRGVYGSEGFLLAADGTQQPSYGQATLAGQSPFTWSASTTDVRALQKSASTTDRIAATWFSDTAFTIDLNLGAGVSHQVALYTVDYDSLNRAERFDVIDPATGTVLDSRTVSSFTGGQYVVWTVTGHVQIRATTVGGKNTVVSGVFFQ